MPAEDPEEGASGPPPHPLDRIWFHPSELGPLGGPSSGPRRSPWSLVGAALGGAAVAALVVLSIAGVTRDHSSSGAPIATAARAWSGPLGATVGGRQGPPEAARAIAAAGASVVAVLTATPAEPGRRLGSGLCVGGGHVLTSAVAIGDAPTVAVVTGRGATVDATVVGRDPTTDLALLRLQRPAPMPVPRLGSADDLRVGARVVALAAGTSRRPWTSTGSVAALNRRVASPSGAVLVGLIRTDADSRAEAAGGALLDATGTVVGVLAQPVEGGPVLALPIDVARDVTAQLVTSGHVLHGWLGVVAGDRHEGGALVADVAAGGPADDAGVAPGDLILGADGRRVSDAADLLAVVQRHRPGDPLTLRVRRAGREADLRVALGAREGHDVVPVEGDGANG